MMCLFTADGFEGTPIPCSEGELAWIPKEKVLELPTWEGDREFLKLLLQNERRFFTLKLVYQGNRLVDKVLKIYENTGIIND